MQPGAGPRGPSPGTTNRLHDTTLESASIAAAEARPREAAPIWEFISKYGLIALLVAFPAYYAITDLADGDGLSRIGNNLVAGISNGSIWALVALGYTLVYGIIELINFAHGEVFMIGSFVAFGLYGDARADAGHRHPRPGRRPVRDPDRLRCSPAGG